MHQLFNSITFSATATAIAHVAAVIFNKQIAFIALLLLLLLETTCNNNDSSYGLENTLWIQ